MSRMNSTGHTTVRGPFVSNQKRKIADLVQSHVFNSEVTCYLPILQDDSSSEIQKEEVKRLEFEFNRFCLIGSFDEEEEEDDVFLSLNPSQTNAIDDKMLLKTNGFYYQIKGRCALLFEVVFSRIVECRSHSFRHMYPRPMESRSPPSTPQCSAPTPSACSAESTLW